MEVLAVETPQHELGFHLEVAAPLPKGDRGQFLIEKLTELGVTAFVPLQTRRSVVHPREARLDKLGRWVIEASKQCGRNVLMAVAPLADWETYCCRTDLPARKWLAHPGFDEVSARSLKLQATALAVGPEGGFTEEEVACALTANWQGMGLGPRILRVETAAVVLASNVIYGA